jgi:ketosteroid isomerase-like protein
MSPVEAYFAAWNAGDGGALVALFAPAGSYCDPTTGGAVAASHLPDVVADLRAAFSDLSFETRSLSDGGGRVAVEWVMRGNNRGSLRPGLAPTGATLALEGVDLFELSSEGILAARRYFDQQTLVERLGLMALVQPIVQGPAEFGHAMRVASGNPRPPGALGLTWIQAADDHEKERIRDHARSNVRDFLEEPGFIAIVTGFTGLRGFTVTAWEDEASMKRALGRHHAVAMQELFGEDFVASVWTSVWSPTRLNRLWLRCPGCASLEDLTDDHRTCRACGEPLPGRPSFW